MDTVAIPQVSGALAEACARRQTGQANRDDERVIDHYMERKPCEKMLPYYERLWTSLADDPDATDAVIDYGWPDRWPPTQWEVVNAYLDLVGLPRARRRHQNEGRYYEVLNQALDAPPEVLVAALGAAERQRAATYDLSRAAFAANATKVLAKNADFGWCALSDRRYLVVVLPAGNSTVALLIAVPYGNTNQDEPTVLGRMWEHHYSFDKPLDLPGDLPAPPPTALPLALRPFASVIPVLLSQAINTQTFAEWRGDDDRDLDEDEEAYVAKEQQKRTIVERALDPLLSKLRWIEALSVLPPEVTPYLDRRPTPYAMYAWFDECQLAEGLAVALGQHAAAAAAPYAAAVRAGSVASERDLTGNFFVAPDKRRRAETTPPTRQTPNRLEALVRRAIARTPAAFAVNTLPWTLRDDVGFDVWQATCNTTAEERDLDPEHFTPLVAVARGWSTEPDEGELKRPRLLCGRLAHTAITRGVRQGERLAPDVSARTGQPTISPGEREAIEAVCRDDQPNRPFERVDRATVDAAVVAAFRDVNDRSPDSDDAPLVATVARLVADANELYGAQPDGRRLHTVHMQSVLALLALRSGANLVAGDLANAGSACAAITPTFALAP
ncbi:hypothetical protein pneo_cds_1077 [Pandoravirus neocaledonia]|uniref:Uncharacterized protein n=1 Tax=Pandoravirus neocaledonia TaxID=2107708 RepID=A0A2U7UE21_9VIRU|nr:hypothetical protein pneo_cds_1077 [Pandoravirus neocaledonia]AVK76684.1 hypothetical protein pneo_cds_1077 [Pandoravirus neocaledonia]